MTHTVGVNFAKEIWGGKEESAWNKIEEKMSYGAKLPYIEYIRVFAALAVVFLHIVMTLNNNYTVEELGVFNYTVFSD